jgi:hypothetical protein
MHKEFVPYELALDLKELGFNEQCFATYRTHAVGSKKPFEYDLDYHTKVEMSSNVIPINSEYTEESKWISAPLYQQAFKFVLGIIENNSKLDRKFRTRFFLDFTYEGFVMDDKELSTTYESDEETLRVITNFIILNK